MSSFPPVNSEVPSSARHAASKEPSPCKKIALAIAIIVGIGALAVAVVGLGGYFQVGALSNLGQVNAIIMMAAGGGGGITLLFVGIVGSVKSRSRSESSSSESSSSESSSSELLRSERGHTNISAIDDTQGGWVYGPKAWRTWGVKVIGTVPKAPKIKRDENDPFFKRPYRENYILMFIPEQITHDGKVKYLTLNTLNEIISQKYGCYSDEVQDKIGDTHLESGWVLMSKDVIPESRDKAYSEQKNMLEETDFRLPHALEAAACISMVHALTEKRPYGNDPLTYTRCEEEVGGYAVLVGGSGPNGLGVSNSPWDNDDDEGCGVGVLWKC